MLHRGAAGGVGVKKVPNNRHINITFLLLKMVKKKMKDTDTPKCGVKRISERNSCNGDASSLWGKDSKVGEFFSFYYFS